MDNIKRYKQISTNFDRVTTRIEAHIPKPNDSDYKRGYITRYFVQASNDSTSPIYEVSSQKYVSYTRSSNFRGVIIRWRISGSIEPIYNDSGNVADKGVNQSNSIAISLVYDKIPNLKLYLPNLLQFYKK